MDPIVQMILFGGLALAGVLVAFMAKVPDEIKNGRNPLADSYLSEEFLDHLRIWKDKKKNGTTET